MTSLDPSSKSSVICQMSRPTWTFLLLLTLWQVARATFTADAWLQQRPAAMPKINNLEVMCESDHMQVQLTFDLPFHGLVSSKGQSINPECVYVSPRSGFTHFTFHIYYNKCGTKPDLHGKFYENTIVVQYDEDLIEVWDEAKRLRCEWFNDYEKTATKTSPVVIADLDVVELDFRGDNVDCWMEIQHGKGPWAPPVSGIVPLGSTLTMVIAVNDHTGEFDMRVKSCEASDGYNRQLHLSDENGCVVRPKMVSRFLKLKMNDGRATVLTYAFFTAFKFPDALSVHLRCRVEICRHGCLEHCPQLHSDLGSYGVPHDSQAYGSHPIPAIALPPVNPNTLRRTDDDDNSEPAAQSSVPADSNEPSPSHEEPAPPTHPPPVEYHQPPFHIPSLPLFSQGGGPPPIPQLPPRRRRPPPPHRRFPQLILPHRRPRPPPPRLEKTSLAHLVGFPFPHQSGIPPQERHSGPPPFVPGIDGKPMLLMAAPADQVEGHPESLPVPVQENSPSESHSPLVPPVVPVHRTEPNEQPLVLPQSEVRPPPHLPTGGRSSLRGPAPRGVHRSDDNNGGEEDGTTETFPYGPRSLEGQDDFIGHSKPRRKRLAVHSRSTRSADVGVGSVFHVVAEVDLAFLPNTTADEITIFKGRLREEVVYGVCLPKAGFGLLFVILGLAAAVSSLVAIFLAYQRQLQRRRTPRSQAAVSGSPQYPLTVCGRVHFCKSKSRRQ